MSALIDVGMSVCFTPDYGRITATQRTDALGQNRKSLYDANSSGSALPHASFVLEMPSRARRKQCLERNLCALAQALWC